MRRSLTACVFGIVTVLGLVASAIPATASPGTGWETAVQISTTLSGVPDVASSADGSSIVVWERWVINTAHISWNRYTPGGGWAGVDDVETITLSARHPKVAMGDTGNAVAVWNQRQPGSMGVYPERIVASTYSPLGGWSSPSILSDVVGWNTALVEPEVAMDDAGNAIAAWIYGDNVYARAYTGGAWQGTEPHLCSDGAATPTDVHVAMGHASAGVVVWSQGADVWANEFSASGWDTANERLDHGTLMRSYTNPSVAMDRLDNVMIVAQYSSSYIIPPWGISISRVLASIARESGTWGAVSVFGGSDSFNPCVAMNNGRGVVVWNQSQGAGAGGRSDVWSNLYTVGSGWSGAEAREVGQYSDGSEPVVVIDSSGDAVAVWHQYVHHGVLFPYDSWDIWGARYVSEGGSWEIRTLDSQGSPNADLQRIAIDGSGIVTVAWRQPTDDVDQIWTNRFDPDRESPVANAGLDQTVNVGAEVTFDAGASTDNVQIKNLTWTFEDGGAKAIYGWTPKYTFSGTGDYTVTLTVRDSEWNTASDTVVITVGDIEDPVANAGPDQEIALDSVATFDGSASTDNVGVVNWTWTFDDLGAQTLYGEAPTYTFQHAGVFTVTLTVKDAAGNSGTDTVVITVPDTVDPVSNAGPDQAVGIGSTVTFDGSQSFDNSGAIASYTWTFTDVTAKTLTGVHATYTFNNEGTFVVALNVTDAAGNWDHTPDTVVITVGPVDTQDPVSNAGPDQSVFKGTTVTFDGSGSSDNSGTISSYTWTFTDGTAKTLAGQKPTYKFDNVGVFVVTLNVTDPSGRWDHTPDTVTITVNAPDTEDPVAEAGLDQDVKTGDTVTFDGSGSHDNSGAIASYTWTLTYEGATKTLTGAKPTMKFDTAGDYVVTLTVKDAAGNDHSDTVTIHVKSGGGTSTLLIAGIGVIAAIAIVAAALLLMRRKKGAAGAPPTG